MDTSTPHSDSPPGEIVAPAALCAVDPPDFVDVSAASPTTSRPARPPATAFEVVVTFESADGMREPVEHRTRVDGCDVDEAARRALVRAELHVGRFDWASVVLVLTKDPLPGARRKRGQSSKAELATADERD